MNAATSSQRAPVVVLSLQGPQGLTTVTQTQWAQPQGVYIKTEIDNAKAAADFRLTARGKKNSIAWRDGRAELVTDRQLEKLQALHSWACDF